MSATKASQKAESKGIRCGIVMPISEWDDCSDTHWSQVLGIIKESLTDVGFEADLVSSAIETSVIQKRIVQSLINDPVVVCDVSGRNPNVMFEVGLRLAFDKPTVIIKDDVTKYNFDIAPIEHLEYPRTLRFHDIREFQKKLAEKVQATHQAFLDNPSSYSCYLKNFDGFKPARALKETEVDLMQYMQSEFAALRGDVESMAGVVKEVQNLKGMVAKLTTPKSSLTSPGVLFGPATGNVSGLSGGLMSSPLSTVGLFGSGKL